MNARAYRRLGALSCLMAAASARVVAAQPEPSGEASPKGVELRYEAFEGCPERAAFAKNLDARRRDTVAAQGTVQMDVRLRPLPARVEGSIVVKTATSAPSARRIVASTCGEAADALALIAALVLQGIEVEEVPPAETDDPADRSTRRRHVPSDSRHSDRPNASEPIADRTTTARTTTNEPSTDTSDEAERTIERAPEPSPQHAVGEQDAGTAAEDDPDDDGERTQRAFVLVSGGIASGVLPALQPVPELSLSLERGAPGEWQWSALAAFRISPEQTRHFDQGVVTFGWWTGLVSLCAGMRGTRVWASGCAALEVGALSGEAAETENPRKERRTWTALGPGIAVGYDVSSALRLVVRAEVLTPLTRYRLELPEGTVVHEPATLGFRAGLGAGLRLW